ncbi:hydroxysteroid 11-beta-dehydrogenase 1-like protein [Lingula anatina]|uniref:Hydroxysteroid 11-beta-dehydrogenase 1-like protein n=1 Tax=Lingula anatina TaxID=7574 RepID=A0A1S3JMB5_LINAN|nr:hydroxysteroid 11-beta-dehydrogenase 1-like protein [Lingula anatina]|eukprot:XP_013411049.1 hydroxysteroid 11-beta-dehydrogenase 1-like protein [Lingula anatina]
METFDPVELFGKNVLITGASSGIGEQMAYHFAKMGANLVLTARRGHLLKKVVSECNNLSPNSAQKHAYIAADMADMTETERVVQFAKESLGGLDIVMLNHALLPFGEPWMSSKENFTKLATAMDVNFRSYVHLASHVLPLLTPSSGRIAVVTSLVGYFAYPYTTWYTAAKRALQGFFGVLRQELKLQNSNVTITMCVVGPTRTENAVESMKAMIGETFVKTGHIADAGDVAMEIIQGTVSRQYQVHTDMDLKTRIFFFIQFLFPKLADDSMLLALT